MAEKKEYFYRLQDGNKQYMTAKEIVLGDLKMKDRKVILNRMRMNKVPRVVIIDGVDGVGKTNVVERIIREWERRGEKVIYNKFKRRRGDNEKFKVPSEEFEWEFRKEVVEEINRRLVTYNDEDWIIVDKSPYSEYYYQRVNEFDRGKITPYGNFLMEKEIFKYKKIIDNAIVIFLENEECWNNYYNREHKKSDGGHQASYETLSKQAYMSMVRSFKNNQNIYDNTKKYKRIEIHNDEVSWKRVYQAIEKFAKYE